MAESRSLSIKGAITALAGGGNTASTPTLDGDINLVTVVGTAADSVRLPASQPAGSTIIARNLAAASLNVFPPSGGTINAGTADAALALATLKTAMYIQTAVDGKTWITLPGA